MSSLRSGALFLFGLVFSGWAGGQARGPDPVMDTLVQIEEVAVTGDRLGLPESRSGRYVSIIHAGEIGQRPVHSLDELLRTLPYLEVQSRGPAGVQSDILIRGSTFNQVLVMLDGMRINDPLTGHFNGYIPVPLTEIARIEIYRGPAAAMHGPDAVGGVVNIITRSFQPGRVGEGIGGQLEAGYGQHKLYHTNSGIYLSRGRWQAGAGVNYRQSEGHPLEGDSLNGDFKLATVSASLSGQVSPSTSLSFRTAFDHRHFNARFFYTNSPYDRSREMLRKWLNQMEIRTRIHPSHTLTLKAAYRSGRDSFLFNPAFPANIHQSQLHDYQLNHLYHGTGGFRLASGIQLSKRQIASNDRGDHSVWHQGIYVIASRSFQKEMTLAAGLRLDHETAYGWELLPQLNFNWQPNEWNFRASAGRSIRAADFTERYISRGLAGPLSPGRNLGNPGLLAERAWSFEGGLDRRLIPSVEMDFTVFYRLSANLIDYVLTPSEEIDAPNLQPGAFYFYAQNIGHLNTAGLETGLSGIHRWDPAWRLTWRISGQLLRSFSDRAVVSKYLASHARQLISGRIGLRWHGSSLFIQSFYKQRDPEVAKEISARLQPSYMIWHLKFNQYVSGESWLLSLQLNNIFNARYADIMGATMPGRWISAGICWKFGQLP